MVLVQVFKGFKFYISISWVKCILKPWPDAQVPSFDYEFGLRWTVSFEKVSDKSYYSYYWTVFNWFYGRIVARRDTLQVLKIIVKYCEGGGKKNVWLKKEKREYNKKNNLICFLNFHGLLRNQSSVG